MNDADSRPPSDSPADSEPAPLPVPSEIEETPSDRPSDPTPSNQIPNEVSSNSEDLGPLPDFQSTLQKILSHDFKLHSNPNSPDNGLKSCFSQTDKVEFLSYFSNQKVETLNLTNQLIGQREISKRLELIDTEMDRLLQLLQNDDPMVEFLEKNVEQLTQALSDIRKDVQREEELKLAIQDQLKNTNEQIQNIETQLMTQGPDASNGSHV